jgi:hypothetical protein
MRAALFRAVMMMASCSMKRWWNMFGRNTLKGDKVCGECNRYILNVSDVA